jgi:SAM-dependent methyltransferase
MSQRFDREARWHSEAGAPPPDRLSPADDRTTAADALARLRRGEHLLYTGDFHNARQLLAALGRKLERSRGRGGTKLRSMGEAFRAQRRRRAEEHALLNRLLVRLDASYRVTLRRGPDLSEACTHAWGPPAGEQTVTSLRELLGIQGAEQWRKKGIAVPGLPAHIHPRYGVFAPTRPEYPQLLAAAPPPTGRRVFDIGTGTGVLGLLMLARGARAVLGTDIDPRAVACAQENAARMGLGDRFVAMEGDLFPPGRADIVVCNPPWIPEVPRTRMDRAVYDPEGAVLRRLLAGLADHLEPGGEGWLIVSDLPELLELRSAHWLKDAIEGAGLRVAWKRTAKPQHARASDPEDLLHAARSRETTTLYALVPVP